MDAVTEPVRELVDCAAPSKEAVSERASGPVPATDRVEASLAGLCSLAADPSIPEWLRCSAGAMVGAFRQSAALVAAHQALAVLPNHRNAGMQNFTKQIPTRIMTSLENGASESTDHGPRPGQALDPLRLVPWVEGPSPARALATYW